MAKPANSDAIPPVPIPRRRGRLRRLVLVLGMPIVMIAGWKSAPHIENRVRLHLAERAIAAGHLDEAEARLDLLIEEKPMSVPPRFLRARVARERGRFSEAEDRLQRAIDLGLPVELARREHDLIRAGETGDPHEAGDQDPGRVARAPAERK